jgi:hypothetical protein
MDLRDKTSMEYWRKHIKDTHWWLFFQCEIFFICVKSRSRPTCRQKSVPYLTAISVVFLKKSQPKMIHLWKIGFTSLSMMNVFPICLYIKRTINPRENSHFGVSMCLLRWTNRQWPNRKQNIHSLLTPKKKSIVKVWTKLSF